MTDIESMLRTAMSDRAGHAPVAHDLAGAARALARRHRRRRVQLASGVTAAAMVLAGAALIGQDRPAADGPLLIPGSALVPDGYSGPFTFSAMVLQSPDRGPHECPGGIAEQPDPPRCDGYLDLVGWSWAGLPHESLAGTRWGGLYVLTGTLDGNRFTLTEPPTVGRVAPAGYPHHIDLASPCPEPPVRPIPEHIPDTEDEGALRAAIAAAESSPDFAAAWDTPDPFRTGIIVRYTGNLEAHEAELRQIWTGPLCVTAAVYRSAELRTARQELVADPNVVGCTLNEPENRVDCTMYLAHESDQRRVDERYGPGLVRLDSLLQPAAARLAYERLPLPTHSSDDDGGMEARLEGVLVRAADDCLYVRESGRLTAVFWPTGYTAWRVPGQPIEVFDAEGRVVLREGDRFAVGGGGVPAEPSRCDPEGSPFMMSFRPERVG